MGKELTLVLGGARSGKSAYAQRTVTETGETVLFAATATAGDQDMAARIAAHQASRPGDWATLEAPLHIGEQILQAVPTAWVIVDCITLLTSNVLFSLPEPVVERDYQQAMQAEIDALLAAYQRHPGRWMIVSNETGLGLVPPAASSRYYRDALGRANQQLARAADRVVLMVAGIPVVIK